VGGPVVDLDTRFPAELVDAYEAGAKTSWFNGTVLLNAAVFHQVYEHFQLNTFTGTQFIVASVPEVISKGIDTDFVLFSPIEGLTVQGGVTYAETQYGDFPVTAGLNARQPGSRISFGPLWSATTAATYERNIGANLVWRTNLAGKFSSKYNTGSDLNPFKAQDQYFVLNARIGIGSESDSWAVELWAQNVLDEEILQVAFDAPAQSDITTAFLAPPATFGLTVRGRY
jgi:outer membrane receptor protein involved in Fe transport